MFHLASLSLAAPNNSSCGSTQPSPVPDCGSVDLGSCGNACCIADFKGSFNIKEFYSQITDFLKKGGDDGSFAYITGPDAAGHNPGDDLTPYGIAWQYVWQGTHTTTGGYVDTIDFNIKKASDDATEEAVVRVSSRSNIHGALGDNGQNHKNVMSVMNTLRYRSPTPTIVHGCGKA